MTPYWKVAGVHTYKYTQAQIKTDTHLFVFEELFADGDVSACAESLAAGAQVPQQAGPLHTPVQGRHVQRS